MKLLIAQTHESVFFSHHGRIMPLVMNDFRESQKCPIKVFAVRIEHLDETRVITGKQPPQHVGVGSERIARVEALRGRVDVVRQREESVMTAGRKQREGDLDTLARAGISRRGQGSVPDLPYVCEDRLHAVRFVLPTELLSPLAKTEVTAFTVRIVEVLSGEVKCAMRWAFMG